jgi:hypothetical protein
VFATNYLGKNEMESADIGSAKALVPMDANSLAEAAELGRQIGASEQKRPSTS